MHFKIILQISRQGTNGIYFTILIYNNRTLRNDISYLLPDKDGKQFSTSRLSLILEYIKDHNHF